MSSVKHDVLSRAIVKDKLDRQNCAISQRFFSESVQKILSDLGFISEAKFTECTQDWFHACDEQGMDVKEKLFKLNQMYEYLLRLVSLSSYPPPT